MDNPSFEFILPKPEDWDILEQIALIEKDAFNEDALSTFNLSLIAMVNSLIAVLHNGNVIAEAVLLYKSRKTGLIFGFAVKESYRKQGIGSKLLEHIISYARKLDLSSLILTVNPVNKNAIHLYQNKFNFQVTNSSVSHPTKDEKRWILKKHL